VADTDDMAIFARVVELGSLSAAGRSLRMSPALVSNRIARLESQLGVRLLNRTTRRVDCTAEGSGFYEHCRAILAQLEQARSELAERTTKPAGPLKVTVPVAFGRRYIAPHIPAFLDRYPDIQVRLDPTDRLVDLIEGQVDLAIRIAALEDSTAIARTLAPNRRFIVAAPSYLDRHGRPQVPEDLLAHTCLLLRFPGSRQYRWTLTTPDGPVTLAVSGRMDSSNGEVLTDWCRAGHGLALKCLWEVWEDLRDGRLEVVLPDHPPPGHAITALYPHTRFLPIRVRVFIDFLVDLLGPVPPWERAAGPVSQQVS
jgi:DNA-binding transcriptional LysR family regulator